MDLSIIIPQYNTVELTLALLHNLKENTSWSYETDIFVVDDGSTIIWELDSPIPIYTCLGQENKGFAAAVNIGIRESSGDYIAIFNNDMTVSTQWDDILIRSLTSNNGRGMVSGEIFEGENCPPYLEPKEITNLRPVARWNKGAPWMFKRSLFNEVGLFDEQFFPGNFEETDLFLRMAINGYVHGSVSNVQCLHKRHGTLATQWTQEEFWRLFHENQKRFLDKWGSLDISYEDARRDRKWGK